MKWRDLLLGALITLIITVIAGVIVYVVTREPKEIKAEKILYSVESPVGFETQSNKVSISNIRVANLGTLPAKNVHIAIELSQNSKIVDKAISSSAGDVGDMTLVTTGDTKLLATTPSLYPDETIVVTILLNATPSSLPKITVKSDSSLGVPGTLVRSVPEPKSKIRQVVPFLLPFLVLLQIPLFLRVRRLGLRGYQSSLNSTAFLYLHQGMTQEAKGLLSKAIAQGKGGALELSNYALCLALENDFEKARKHIAAALFFKPGGHIYAVVMFNSALVHLLAGQIENATQDLGIAVSKSKVEIDRYCKYSIVVAPLLQTHPQLRGILVGSTPEVGV